MPSATVTILFAVTSLLFHKYGFRWLGKLLKSHVEFIFFLFLDFSIEPFYFFYYDIYDSF